MSGTIFVAPTRYFAVMRATGDFEIRDVAPGRYKLDDLVRAAARRHPRDPGGSPARAPASSW